ncbi:MULTISPECIES: phosphatase PAP2 family protein [unclassified Streptomyces]|uniref:phosphatase PAP2 family protein n=1 Tax=unclassified Streptomyces TaxID=2593676 RepID=UPI00380B1C7A
MSGPATVDRRTRWRLPPPIVVAVLCAVAFALLTVAVAGRHGAPFPVDRSALTWSVDHRPPLVKALARAVTASGTGPLPYLGAVVGGVLAGSGTRRRLYGAAGALLFLLAGQAVRYGLVRTIARPRPPVEDWATHASGYAFPSGHTTTSALVAGVLIWGVARASRRGARAGGRAAGWLPTAYSLMVLLGCWAVAVGLSRIYLGVHWATDVLGGWLFAGVWLGLGATLVRGRFPGPDKRRAAVR